MNIAILGYTLNVAGAGARQYASLLARAMADRGHQVSIVAAAGGDRTHTEPRIRYVDLADRRLPSLSKFAAFLLTAAKHFIGHAKHYDIIHSVSGYHSFAIVTQFLRMVVKTPVIHTVLAECGQPWLFRGVSPLICISKITQKKFSSNQTVHIPTAIDLKRFHPREKPPSGCFMVGSMGSTAPRRGMRFLVEAIPTILQCHPNTHFSLAIDLHQPGVAGETDSLRELRYIRRFIESHGLEDSVTILGEVSVPEFLSSLDLFVYPVQTTRGMIDLPPTILECLAVGVPVITTHQGGIPEVLKHEHNALLVNPDRHADPEEYARLVKHLIEDRHLAQQLGQEGLRTVRAFDIETIAPIVEQVYYSVVTKKRTNSSTTS